MRIAATVAGLGTPTEDGELAVIRTANCEEILAWNDAEQTWVGKPRWTMRQIANEGLSSNGAPTAWRYPGAQGEVPETRLGKKSLGFQIHKLNEAGELWAAGLRLQEHLSAEIKVINYTGTTTEVPEISLAWYPLAQGDSFLSPASFNHGVHLQGVRDNWVYRWFSSGWQNNTGITVPPDSDELFYPELYTTGPLFNFRHFSARHRWVAGDPGGAGSTERPSKYPIADVAGWYDASLIRVADNSTVAEWPDYSGRGNSLVQTDSAKRPVVRRDGPGDIRHVRFNGTDDIMKTISELEVAQPMTISMVIRQRSGGGGTQVWWGRGDGSGQPLIYRSATNQLNIWFGAGGDMIYTRASEPWPWMVWTIVLNNIGSTASVYEGSTLVATGTPGPGGNKGFTLGNNFGEAFPAAIDVAELVYSFRAADSTERAALVTALEDKYGL